MEEGKSDVSKFIASDMTHKVCPRPGHRSLQLLLYFKEVFTPHGQSPGDTGPETKAHGVPEKGVQESTCLPLCLSPDRPRTANPRRTCTGHLWEKLHWAFVNHTRLIF